MAWSTPRTWNAGETVTSTLLNTHLRDQLNVLATFVKGGAFVQPTGITAAINIVAWRAMVNCTVAAVKGYRFGGTGATVNARKSRPQVAAGQAWRVTAVGPVYVDETADLASAAANDVQPLPTGEAVGDYFAVGFAQKFRALRIQIGTAGTGTATLAWEYWNGVAWAALADVSDGTGALKNAAGIYEVTFTPPSDWATSIINGSALLYYVRARLSANSYTVDPLITQGWVIEGGNHLAAALSLATAGEWLDGGSVQNTSYVVGDAMEIMIVSVTGSPIEVAIQVELALAP